MIHYAVKPLNVRPAKLRQGKFASLDGTASEFHKLLAEKTHLLKELSELKSQFEGLSTSCAFSQDVLAEKQGLERQLTTLEVQLEDEKRARERIQSRNIQQGQEIEGLSLQIEKARKETEGTNAKEQERIARQREHEWATQRSSFEEKIETLDRQLRSMKDQLQETRKTQRYQPGNIVTGDTSEATPQNRVNPVQRSTTQFNPDITIATPGAIQTYEGPKRPSALPGDKSAFSITPYLNRTNGQQDLGASSDDDLGDFGTVNVKEGNMSPSRGGSSGEEKATASRPGDQAARGKLSRKPVKQKSAHRSMSTKPQVKESQAKPSDNVDSDHQLEDSSGLHAHAKGKGLARKRKLGTQRERSIFDEEEDELHEQRKPARKFALGTGRKQTLSGFQQTVATKNQPQSNQGFGVSQAFSPLKRDKKRH